MHVDDCAERALERAAAAGIEARVMANRAADDLGGQHRRRQVVEARKVVEIVIDGFELAARSIGKEVVEAAFELAREQGRANAQSSL